MRNTLYGLLVIGLSAAAQAEPLFQQTDVFVAGDGNVHTYRIPAVIVTQKGTVLAFSEARKVSQGDQTPTDMVLRRSFDQGATWQKTQIVVPGQGREAIMNPTPVIDKHDGAILLLCNRHPSVHVQYKPGAIRLLLVKSTDDGASWSDPVDLTKQVTDPNKWEAGLGVGPGVGIQASSGRLVVPFWHFEPGLEGDFLDRIIYSEDHGQTWKRGDPVPGFGNESQVVELADGSLMLNIRATSGGGCRQNHRRKIAISRDGGLTWPEAYLDRALVTPCCQGSFLRYTRAGEGRSRNRVLFSNPGHASERINMSVRLSYDEGTNWAVSKSVNGGPSAYSCLTVLSDGTIGLVYETGESHPYEKIRFARFSLQWLTNGKDQLSN